MAGRGDLGREEARTMARSRLDLSAAAGHPGAVAHSVRCRRAELRGARPARRRPRRARPPARRGQGAIIHLDGALDARRRHDGAPRRHASTASPPAPTGARAMLAGSRAAPTRWSPASACSAPGFGASRTVHARHLPAAPDAEIERVRGERGVGGARRRLRDPGPRRQARRADRRRLPQRRRASRRARCIDCCSGGTRPRPRCRMRREAARLLRP